MVNPRRPSHANNNNNTQDPENPSHSHTTQSSSSSYTLLYFLKKPQAFPILLTIFIFLTWVSLRFQNPSPHPQKLLKWSKENDLRANLVRFLPFQLVKDKRGWLLNPLTAAHDVGIHGGAVTCTSVHVGEIRPGGIRGNHRHYASNETFIMWGAQIKFRLENSQVADKGYAEVIIGADEVAVAASPSGIAHALVNIDPLRTAFLLGCQDNIVSNNGSKTVYNIWKDL